MTREKSLGREIIGLLFHGAFAAFAGTIIGCILTSLFGSAIVWVFDVRSSEWKRLLGDVPYSPFIWGSGLLLGFLINRRMQDRSACWLGVFGVLVFLLLMAWDVSLLRHSVYYRGATGGHFWKYEVGQLFALNSNVCGNSECLGELFFTTPFFSLISYSVGACIGFLKPQVASGDVAI
jgi:FtsH-binding integral membrane protein